MKYLKRIIPELKQSYFLFGPRGSGKSTWLKHACPEALYLDLLDPVLYRNLNARPELLRQQIADIPKKQPVIIDEIQKVPGLLDVVHQLIEGAERNRQFILTGSSARKLRRTGVNLLGGRLLWRQFHPYLAAELGGKFNLNKAVLQGMLPLVHAAQNPAMTLNSYSTLYIQQEVREEASVRDLGGFNRFLEAVSLSHGGQLNLNDLSRECSVTRKSVEGYLNVLEDMMLAQRLNVFGKRAKRLLASHPKFYFFDAGVFQALRPRNLLDSDKEVRGAALEGLVAQHLQAWLSFANGKNELFYWRTRAGLEVDFVIFGESVFLAVEVKSGKRIDSEDAAGLKAFKNDYPEAEVVLLAPEPDKSQINGIRCMDVTEFLLGIKPREKLL